MLNKENVLKLADHLDRLADIETIAPIGFSMSTYFSTMDQETRTYFNKLDTSAHFCDTTACIAGHVAVMALGSVELARRLDHSTSIDEFAADWLGDRDLADSAEWNHQSLFFGQPSGVEFHGVTPKQAANTLRYLAEHGVVDWDKANGIVTPEEDLMGD